MDQSILLKEHLHIIVVGCTSHSFNLCSWYACQKLPKGVEVLKANIYSHFAPSPKSKYFKRVSKIFGNENTQNS